MNFDRKTKTRQDKNSKLIKYNVGDKVLEINNSGNKKHPVFNGPYLAVEDQQPNVIIRVASND